MCVYICIGGGHAVLNEMILFFLKPIFTVKSCSLYNLSFQPIKEGNFIIQPKVDFDISICTVAGLLNLGYVPFLLLKGWHLLILILF